MFLDDPYVVKWLGGLAESTKRNRLPLMNSFFDFIGSSPGEAVEFQKGNPMSYKFVDLAYKWIEEGNLGVGTMHIRVSMINGFFIANRVPLPKDRHKFHSDKEPVFGELTVDELKKVLVSCKLNYRCPFLIMFQSGSGVGELRYINEHHADHVWNMVRKGKQIIRLNMPGRKAKRNVQPYYTFIGTDAIETLKQFFHSRGWKKDNVLFRNEYENPLTTNNLQTHFRSHAFKVGIIKRYTPACLDCGGETVRQEKPSKSVNYVCTVCQSEYTTKDYGVTPQVQGGIRYRAKTHELRDLFRTEFHRAQTYANADPAVAEFCMGHTSTIDPLKYDKIMHDASYTLSEYRKALPYLNIMSEDPRTVPRTEIDKELEAYKAESMVLRKEVLGLQEKVRSIEDAFEERWRELKQRKNKES